MYNIAGSPVEGENFFGRETEVTHLDDILRNDDILLLGPRRIGKTSIARAVMARVRADGGRVVEINVASCTDECGFLDKLDAALTPELESIGSKVTNTIRSALSNLGNRLKSIKLSIEGAGELGVDLGVAPAMDDWTKVGCDVIRLIAQVEQRWLVYVDELPIMLFNIIRSDPKNGIQRVRRFLDWFRNDVRAVPGSHAVRWLVSGSVGLDTLVQQHGMADTINSLSHQTLAPFQEQVAVDMLLQLEQRYQIGLTPPDARDMVKEVGWAQPYYLQMAFHHLRSMVASTPDPKSMATLIPRAIDCMAEPGADNDFHHWSQRLELQLGHNESRHAQAMLNLVAQTAEGARPETLLAMLEERMPNTPQEDVREVFISLRDVLERDAYWLPSADSGSRRYRFRLEPLRRWWLRRNTL
jgi:hypothetical protein